MKNRFTLIIKAVLITAAIGLSNFVFAQKSELEKKLQNFFFDLSFYVDIEVIRKELSANPEFKSFNDPNRDAKKTIVGTIAKDKNLNPIAASNQLIVQYEGKKQKRVSFKWSIHYKLEDLPSATVDFENLKTEFKPFFTETVEKKTIGQHKEQINALTLISDSKEVTIRLISYNNFSHSVSMEYRDKWR